MSGVLASDVELHRLASISDIALERTLKDVLRAKLDYKDASEPLEKLQRLLAQTLAMASLLGRRRVLLAVRAKARAHGHKAAFRAAADRGGCSIQFATDEISPFVPQVEFTEAVEDLLTRYPSLAPGYKAVQELYSKGHSFALAKSTNLVLTKKIQQVLQKSIAQGAGLAKTRDVIANLGGWTRAYSECIYRTGAATAYMSGVVAQMDDPDVAEVMPAMQFIGRSVPPSDVNCTAAVGLIASTKDPIWNKYAPPFHFNCGHGLSGVDRWELKERGLLTKQGTVRIYTPPNFAAAGPLTGFGKGNLRTRLGRVG